MYFLLPQVRRKVSDWPADMASKEAEGSREGWDAGRGSALSTGWSFFLDVANRLGTETGPPAWA